MESLFTLPKVEIGVASKLSVSEEAEEVPVFAVLLADVDV